MISNPDAAKDQAKGEGTLKFILKIDNKFGKVRSLIPECVLIGSNEELPCLATGPNSDKPCLPADFEDDGELEVESMMPITMESLEI